MAVNYIGYPYGKSSKTSTVTDGKVGGQWFSGATAPTSAQEGDLWLTDGRVKRRISGSWVDYVTGYTPDTKIRSGRVIVYPDSTGHFTVNFSSQFRIPPIVTVSRMLPPGSFTPTAVTYRVKNVTRTSFQVYVSDYSNTSPVTSGGYLMGWIAVPANATAAQSGSVAYSDPVSGLYTVTFDTPFATTPAVNVSYLEGSNPTGIGFSVKNISTTGFRIYTYTPDIPPGTGFTTLSSGDFAFAWEAVASGSVTQETGKLMGDTGTVTLNGSGYQTVNFPETFIAVPNVVVTPKDNPASYYPAYFVRNITLTGFDLYVYRSFGDGTAASGTTPSFSYIAAPGA